jgi:hypothetical protein
MGKKGARHFIQTIMAETGDSHFISKATGKKHTYK